jgi:hypothetical protein
MPHHISLRLIPRVRFLHDVLIRPDKFANQGNIVQSLKQRIYVTRLPHVNELNKSLVNWKGASDLLMNRHEI